MRVTIQNRNVDLGEQTNETIQRRFDFALSRFAPRLRDIRVRLTDLNAERGGIDKQCSVEATLAPRGSIVVEVRDSEVGAAVSRAADRLARRLTDEFERRRDLRRVDETRTG